MTLYIYSVPLSSLVRSRRQVSVTFEGILKLLYSSEKNVYGPDSGKWSTTMQYSATFGAFPLIDRILIRLITPGANPLIHKSPPHSILIL